MKKCVDHTCLLGIEKWVFFSLWQPFPLYLFGSKVKESIHSYICKDEKKEGVEKGKKKKGFFVLQFVFGVVHKLSSSRVCCLFVSLSLCLFPFSLPSLFFFLWCCLKSLHPEWTKYNLKNEEINQPSKAILVHAILPTTAMVVHSTLHAIFWPLFWLAMKWTTQ